MTGRNSHDEKIIKHRNPVAKDLGSKKYRQRLKEGRKDLPDDAKDWEEYVWDPGVGLE